MLLGSQTHIYLDKLRRERKLDFIEYKFLLEEAYYLLLDDKKSSYNTALAIICHIAETNPQDPFIKQLLYDCIVASRVFLYGDMLEKSSTDYFQGSYTLIDDFSREFYKLDSGTTLTKDQRKLFHLFQEKRRLVVSAPTSFGKSRIVPELIVVNNYQSVAVVLPTIALLNETYNTFKNNKCLESYDLINSISQPISSSKNILILTPEKMDIFLDENPDFKFDFFVMDEIYKIQDDAERKQIFTHCLYRLSKRVKHYYLIGPYFESFSPRFLARKEASFVKFDTEIVQKDIYYLNKVEVGNHFSIEQASFKKVKTKKRNLVKLLNVLPGQSFVYVSDKRKTETLAKGISAKKESVQSNEFTNYIKESIDKDWLLAKCLEKGVAFHNGSIPRYIQREIVDAFNNGSLSTIICTSTLIEGVNTSAKNVIIFDNFKGKDTKLSPLDVKNIKGRAGRLLSHFVGRVITFEELDESDVGENIEFSYFDNLNLDFEESIQVEKADLEQATLEKREEAELELKKRGIPIELIKKNKFISVSSQINLINHFRDNPEYIQSLSFDGALPTKETLRSILDLCHQFLFVQKDRFDKSFSLGNLKRLVSYYVYSNPSIKELIEQQNGKTVDTKVRSAFTLISRYFEFSLPRYLVAFENIYNFSFQGRVEINLKYLTTKLEFGFVNKYEIALKEAGVPHGIIRKIAPNFSDCSSLQMIKKKVRSNPAVLTKLSTFEQQIFNKYV